MPRAEKASFSFACPASAIRESRKKILVLTLLRSIKCNLLHFYGRSMEAVDQHSRPADRRLFRNHIHHPGGTVFHPRPVRKQKQSSALEVCCQPGLSLSRPFFLSSFQVKSTVQEGVTIKSFDKEDSCYDETGNSHSSFCSCCRSGLPNTHSRLSSLGHVPAECVLLWPSAKPLLETDGFCLRSARSGNR